MGVHAYQTDDPPVWLNAGGSPASSVAPTLVPSTEPESPLMTCTFATRSFVGAGGGVGVTAVDTGEGWLLPLEFAATARGPEASAQAHAAGAALTLDEAIAGALAALGDAGTEVVVGGR